MSHLQIDWIDEARESARDYRRMVVGWQSMRSCLNSTVTAFNELYLSKGKAIYPHAGMEELAAKRLTLSAICEIKPQLQSWSGILRKASALSNRTRGIAKSLKKQIDKAESFRKIRNLAFHFGDATMDTDELVQLYREIDSIKLDEINAVMRALLEFGEALVQDSMEHTG